MAILIDGSSHPGYFKLTADDSAPNAHYLAPKSIVVFQSTDAAAGVIKFSDVNFSTDATVVDENGNALDTSAKVARYLADNKSF